MKKTLALVLAVLVALSMFSVATFAADDTAEDKLVKITFYNDDGATVITVIEVKPGTVFTTKIPENPKAPVAPEEGYKYTFKGWRGSDGTLYHIGNMNPASEDMSYTAEFSAEKVKKTQSLFKFFETIFERINKIFEYFAEIFRTDK